MSAATFSPELKAVGAEPATAVNGPQTKSEEALTGLFRVNAEPSTEQQRSGMRGKTVARIRTIKPEFFLHEGLAELSPLHRLLFIGLWTLADKRGVLEDRPRKIKAALFPWESACDVDAMLWDLAEAGLIRRFVGPNKR